MFSSCNRKIIYFLCFFFNLKSCGSNRISFFSADGSKPSHWSYRHFSKRSGSFVLWFFLPRELVGLAPWHTPCVLDRLRPLSSSKAALCGAVRHVYWELLVGMQRLNGLDTFHCEPPGILLAHSYSLLRAWWRSARTCVVLSKLTLFHHG